MSEERGPLPDLSITRLRIFAAVVEQGGYSAAASSLAISQPTVSFHIRALERAFGTPLVVYRGRRVHLTAAGQALHGLARRTLRDAETLAAQLADLRAGRAGRVRLGASIAFEQAFFFDDVIAPFQQAHPTVELSLRFGHSVHMAEAVRSREIDLAYVRAGTCPATWSTRPCTVAASCSSWPRITRSPGPRSASSKWGGRVSSPPRSTAPNGSTTGRCCARLACATTVWPWRWTAFRRASWPPRRASACWAPSGRPTCGSLACPACGPSGPASGSRGPGIWAHQSRRGAGRPTGDRVRGLAAAGGRLLIDSQRSAGQ